MTTSDLDPRPRRDVDLVGHEDLRRKLARAADRGLVPTTLLLAGPVGIGKGRLAGWTARRLLCHEAGEDGPCGGCASCRRVRGLAHPDLHWYIPHENPGPGSLDRQVAAVEAARAERLRAIRADALHPGLAPGETYYLATVRALRQAAYRRPVEGARKVFVITAAHELARVGGATSEAANAVLKLLEEPPAGTHFLLTSSAPDRLPRTIRSRAAEIRVGPLDDESVERVVRAALRQVPEDLEEAVVYAEGAPGRARRWWDADARERRQAALGIVRALITRNPRLRHERVDEQGFRGARKEFAALLAEVERLLVAGGRQAAGHRPPPGDLADLLDALPDRMHPGVGGWCRAAARTVEAQRQARVHGNPKLILHTLMARATADLTRGA